MYKITFSDSRLGSRNPFKLRGWKSLLDRWNEINRRRDTHYFQLIDLQNVEASCFVRQQSYYIPKHAIQFIALIFIVRRHDFFKMTLERLPIIFTEIFTESFTMISKYAYFEEVQRIERFIVRHLL